MITLATLSTASAQEVYNQIATHLLTQGQRCESEGTCMYRADGGMRCAAGCLIGDDEYHPEWENRSWESLIRDENVCDNHASLISALQSIHDSQMLEEWGWVLKELGLKRKLEIPAIVEAAAKAEGGEP